MNSVAENANQIQADMAQAMRFCAKLPETFWAEAMRHAIWILNVLIHKDKDATPYKSFYGRDFNYDLLHPFGCHVFVHVPKKYRGGKLRSKTCPGIYLGISDCQRGHKVFDVERRVVFIAHSIVFDDASFGVKELKNRVGMDDINIDELECDEEELQEEKLIAEEKMLDMESEVSSSQVEQEDEEEEEEVFYNLKEIEQLEKIDQKSERPKREVKSTRQIDYIYGKARRAVESIEDDKMTPPKTPKSFRQAVNGADGPKWNEAMKRELAALEKLNTFDIVERPVGEHIHRGVWSYRVKTKDSMIISYKARYCVDGSVSIFEKEETFSPVAMPESLQMLIALAVSSDLVLYNGDIPTAYVRANIPEHMHIYVEQPQGYEMEPRSKVWKLKRALYGLAVSGALWNKTLDEALQNTGFVPSVVDPCLYLKDLKSGRMYLAVVVDDILVLPPNIEEYRKFREEMGKLFDYKDLGVCEWFLGIKFKQEPDGIFISQEELIRTIISKYKLDASYDTPMESGLVLQSTGEEFVEYPYRELCGHLRYLTKTRPDIEFALNQCCRMQGRPEETHVRAIKRVVGYLKKNINYGMWFRNNEIGDEKRIIVEAYADASFADEKKSRKSTYGYCIFVNGNPIVWKSGLSPIVTQSCTETEYIAICQCAKEMSFISNLATSIGLEVHKPMRILSDSESAIAIAKARTLSQKSKHIELRFYYIRDKVKNGEIAIEKVGTDDNVADMFTKALGRIKFQKHRDSIMNHGHF
jgi:histone deacetylase 1/2